MTKEFEPRHTYAPGPYGQVYIWVHRPGRAVALERDQALYGHQFIQDADDGIFRVWGAPLSEVELEDMRVYRMSIINARK